MLAVETKDVLTRWHDPYSRRIFDQHWPLPQNFREAYPTLNDLNADDLETNPIDTMSYQHLAFPNGVLAKEEPDSEGPMQGMGKVCRRPETMSGRELLSQFRPLSLSDPEELYIDQG